MVLLDQQDRILHLGEQIDQPRRMRGEDDLSWLISFAGIGEADELIEEPAKPAGIETRLGLLDTKESRTPRAVNQAQQAQSQECPITQIGAQRCIPAGRGMTWRSLAVESELE